MADLKWSPLLLQKQNKVAQSFISCWQRAWTRTLNMITRTRATEHVSTSDLLQMSAVLGSWTPPLPCPTDDLEINGGLVSSTGQSLYLNLHRFNFIRSRNFYAVVNLEGLLALFPGLDLRPKVQVPLKLKACLYGRKSVCMCEKRSCWCLMTLVLFLFFMKTFHHLLIFFKYY